MGMFDKFRNKAANTQDQYDPYNDEAYGSVFGEAEDAYAQNNQGYGDQGFYAEQPAYGEQMNTAAPMNSAPAGAGMALSGSAIELKVVKPTEFKNASQIADHLLNNRTVVLNLEATDKENARRLIDFLTGVAYSIDGQIKRVANNAYVITPNNVDISGDQMRRSQQAQAQAQPQPQQPAAEEFYDLA